ncbi:MAG: SRPBCC family protein [Acidimicrobiales bacterium]
MRIRSDQHHDFDVAPAELWAAMERVDDYRAWWPWLRHFEASVLADGEVWGALVRPPLPYRLRFDLHLHAVEAPHQVSAEITGDIVGSARIEITPTASGCSLHVVSDLAPANSVLRSVMRVAPRMARFGHDWVLTTGLRQFTARALP